jgi:hypothetical protein
MDVHPDEIQFAGDYRLDGVILHNHNNEGGTRQAGIFDKDNVGINIQDLIVEMNIFEGINKSSVTGSLVIADSINLIGNLPIQGTERLSFKLSTPGAHDHAHIVDCSTRTGHPMHIYKLTDKQQLNDGTQVYTLHFCSREFLRNIRTKVSEAFTGTIDQMVYKILGDENYLDSRKQLYYQKTRNTDKFVMPTVPPFKAIEMLCKRALADDSKGVGYHFYQTTKGFHFRSFESMCVNSNGIPRKVKQEFNYHQGINTDDKITELTAMDKDGNEINRIVHDFTSVERYKFINNFHDVAMNQAVGTYGHRVITHNIYDKSYKISDYHYHNYFNDTKHIDESNAPAIVDSPVDYDDKGVSDYPESRVTVMATTQFAHNEDTGAFGIDVEQDGITEGARISQRAAVEAGTRLKLTVKGMSYLQPGDVIQFNIISVENRRDSDGALDPQFAGRYIIAKIRHRISQGEYIQVLECVKDSVFNAYSKGDKSYQADRLITEKGPSLDIHKYDDLADDLAAGRPIRL